MTMCSCKTSAEHEQRVAYDVIGGGNPHTLGHPTEFVRVTEDELADALVMGALTSGRLPYHYPSCSTGTCVGCDAQAGVDAAHLMGGVS